MRKERKVNIQPFIPIAIGTLRALRNPDSYRDLATFAVKGFRLFFHTLYLRLNLFHPANFSVYTLIPSVRTKRIWLLFFWIRSNYFYCWFWDSVDEGKW